MIHYLSYGTVDFVSLAKSDVKKHQIFFDCYYLFDIDCAPNMLIS